MGFNSLVALIFLLPNVCLKFIYVQLVSIKTLDVEDDAC